MFLLTESTIIGIFMICSITIQKFCSQAVTELKELREGQEHLQQLVNEEVHSQSQPETNDNKTQESAPLNIIRVPTKGNSSIVS